MRGDGFSCPLTRGKGRVGNFYKCRWTFKAGNTDQGFSLVSRFQTSGWNSNSRSHKFYYMSSSASSSENVPSSTKISPLSNFDPFAVHPFTSYTSSNPNGNPQLNCDRSKEISCGLEESFHAPQPTIPISSSHPPSSSPKPHGCPPSRGRCLGIFVPFRQETSSPDLSDVLKPKSEQLIIKSSKTHPIPDTAPYIPAAPIGH